MEDNPFDDAYAGQLSYIDSLLNMAEITNEEYAQYKKKCCDLGVMEAEDLIQELLKKQRNPILGGYNYHQKDIIKMLKLLKDERI